MMITLDDHQYQILIHAAAIIASLRRQEIPRTPFENLALDCAVLGLDYLTTKEPPK